MKSLICVLLFMWFWFNGVSQSTTDSLKPFTAELRAGDIADNFYDLWVYIKGNKYYAANETTGYLSRIIYDSNWETILDSNKIKSCLGFINEAKKLSKTTCPKLQSSAHEDLNITYGGEKIRVYNCTWDCCDYGTLEQALFGDNSGYYWQKKPKLQKRVEAEIKGKWYLKPFDKEPKDMDTVVLTRQPQQDTTSYWLLGDSGSFKSNYSPVLDLSHSNKYSLGFTSLVISFSIEPGAMPDNIKKGRKKNNSQSPGTRFSVDSISPSRIVLKFWWR